MNLRLTSLTIKMSIDQLREHNSQSQKDEYFSLAEFFVSFGGSRLWTTRMMLRERVQMMVMVFMMRLLLL